MKNKMMIAGLALLISGCAQQTFSVKREPALVPQKVVTHHFFISGLGQQKTIDAAAICGGADKVIAAEAQQTFVNTLVGMVTFGIYTPREARVYCGS